MDEYRNKVRNYIEHCTLWCEEKLSKNDIDRELKDFPEELKVEGKNLYDDLINKNFNELADFIPYINNNKIIKCFYIDEKTNARCKNTANLKKLSCGKCSTCEKHIIE